MMALSGAKYPEDRNDLGHQSQKDHDPGHASKAKVRHSETAMLTFGDRLRGFPSVEPPKIFGSWVVGRLRGRLFKLRPGRMVRAGDMPFHNADQRVKAFAGGFLRIPPIPSSVHRWISELPQTPASSRQSGWSGRRSSLSSP